MAARYDMANLEDFTIRKHRESNPWFIDEQNGQVLPHRQHYAFVLFNDGVALNC